MRVYFSKAEDETSEAMKQAARDTTAQQEINLIMEK